MLRQLTVIAVFVVLAVSTKREYDGVLGAVVSRKSVQPNGSVSFEKYMTLDEINAYLNTLASNYPDTVTVGSIGNSSQGRPLSIIKISYGGDGSRPVILIDAGIHGNEWICPATALYIINQLVENEDNKDLISSVDWHIVPSLNPDGYHYTLSERILWRKTFSNRSATDFECLGTDANRNFGFHWKEGGSSDDPCSQLYAGPEAFSEPETSALRDYVLGNKDRIKLYLTLHSNSQAFLYPWGFTTDLPDNWETLDAIAQRANAAQVAAGGKNFSIGSSTNELYISTGDSADWVKGVGGVALSYSVELSGDDFWPAKSEIFSLVSEFFPAIRSFGEYIAENF